MLKLFATNPGRVLSKQELMEAVWPDIHVGEDSLFQSIRELRTALGDEQRQIIKLMSGRGYLFAAVVSGGADTDAAGPARSAIDAAAENEPLRAGAILACAAAQRSWAQRGSAWPLWQRRCGPPGFLRAHP